MAVSNGRKVALVTGASRGIGRATALALASAGFDVALLARTQRAGEGRDDSDVGNGRAVPGSLEETADAIAAVGGGALPVVADLLDRASLAPAVGVVLDKWGRVDVLVNNAVDTGAGGMVPVVELTPEQLERKLDANVVSQLVITQAALPDMLERGTGIIINVTSTVAVSDPPAPVGKGGWGLSYAASKGAFHRMAGILAVELGDRGIEAFNVDPGFVDTERQIVNALGERVGRSLCRRTSQRAGGGHRLARDVT